MSTWPRGRLPKLLNLYIKVWPKLISASQPRRHVAFLVQPSKKSPKRSFRKREWAKNCDIFKKDPCLKNVLGEGLVGPGLRAKYVNGSQTAFGCHPSFCWSKYTTYNHQYWQPPGIKRSLKPQLPFSVGKWIEKNK